MNDFSHLAKLQIAKDKPVKFELSDILGQPYLMVLTATEGNKAYFNAALKSQRKNKISKVIDLAFIEKGRNKDKALYPKYIIKGWGNVKNSNGDEVPFSEAKVVEFIEALPNYLFDELRDFCQDPKNFSEENVEEIAKN